MSIITGNRILAQDLANAALGSAVWGVNFGGNPAAATTSPPGEYQFGIRASFGVASVVRNNIGDYTITFDEPMSSSDYVVASHCGFGGDPTNPNDQISDATQAIASEIRGGLYVSRTPTFIRISTCYLAPNGGSTVYDLARISVLGWNAPNV